MKRDMKRWLEELRGAPVKKAMPVLSFPAIQLMGISVRELISSSDAQARGMHLVAQRTDAAASVSLMDLSVEAECFGSAIRVSDEEVPTVVGSIVSTEEEARALAVPPVGAGRTGLYIEAIEKAVGLITDRPVFAGVNIQTSIPAVDTNAQSLSPMIRDCVSSAGSEELAAFPEVDIEVAELAGALPHPAKTASTIMSAKSMETIFFKLFSSLI